MTTHDLPVPDDAVLSSREARALRAIAGTMIPASTEFGVPGADDERIFADLVATAGAERDGVREALRQLDRVACGAYADLAADRREAAADAFRREFPQLALLLVSLTARCYYRDDRVMRSLGMEVRPPFPQGFEVATGDWSLLEPVRARAKIWRDAP